MPEVDNTSERRKHQDIHKIAKSLDRIANVLEKRFYGNYISVEDAIRMATNTDNLVSELKKLEKNNEKESD